MSTSTGSRETAYTLDNAAQGERDRLRALERAYDPGSIRHFEDIGVAEGWSVLMVAGGGGSLVEWICQRVGPTGRVLATDLDPRFLLPLTERYDQLEVRQHNVVADELPEGEFDLAHTRLLLGHLPQREDVARKMVAALKPRGWLLVEEFDWATYGPAQPHERARELIDAGRRFIEAAGFDPYLGRKLPGMLRGIGLEQVDAEGRLLTYRGVSSPIVPMYVGTMRQLAPRLLEQGMITQGHIDDFHERMANPEHDGMGHVMMSAWGRRPA